MVKHFRYYRWCPLLFCRRLCGQSYALNLFKNLYSELLGTDRDSTRDGCRYIVFAATVRKGGTRIEASGLGDYEETVMQERNAELPSSLENVL